MGGTRYYGHSNTDNTDIGTPEGERHILIDKIGFRELKILLSKNGPIKENFPLLSASSWLNGMTRL